MNEYPGDIIEIIVPNSEEPSSPDAQPAAFIPPVRNNLHYNDRSFNST